MRVQGNVALALRTLLLIGKRLLLEAGHQRIHRQHHKIVHGSRDQQKRDEDIQEIAVEKLRAVPLEIQAGEIGLAGDSRDEE